MRSIASTNDQHFFSRGLESDMAIFTHVVLGTNDVEKSRKFYDATLGALGIKNLGPFGDKAFLYGKDAPEFLITKPAADSDEYHGIALSLAWTSRLGEIMAQRNGRP